MNATDQVRKAQQGLANSQGGDTSIETPVIRDAPGHATSPPARGSMYEEMRVARNGDNNQLREDDGMAFPSYW